MNSKLCLAIVVSVCVMAATPAVRGQEYSLTPLGFLPGGAVDGSWGWGIDDRVHICGESTSAASMPFGTVEAFFWDNGVMTPLGNLQPNPFHSRGRDVNNSGVVVGWSLTPAGWQAFRWDQVNGMVGLGYIDGCPSGEGQTFTSYGEGINIAGEIVGCTSTSTSCGEAYLWSNGSYQQTLGFLTGDVESCGYDINNANPVQVVGQSADANGSREAFLWDTNSGMVGLGMVTGNDESSGVALNDPGDVAGVSYNNIGGSQEATVWLTSNGLAPQGLGYLLGSDTVSQAWDINDNVQVVGMSETIPGSVKAFIWDPCNDMRDLNNLVDASGAGWSLMYGMAINRSGQIAGYGRNPAGDFEAFLLTPILGACCDVPGAGGCILTTGSDCICSGGTYQGSGTGCFPDPCVPPPPPCQQRVRISQESQYGAGDFDANVLGCVEVYQATGVSAAGYYLYDLGGGHSASYNGTAPDVDNDLVADRSHLFLVNTTDGLSLFVVHDQPNHVTGGRRMADMRFELVNGMPLARTVEDDPVGGLDIYTGVPTGDVLFTSHHDWGDCCTDGQVLSGLDANHQLLVNFTQKPDSVPTGNGLTEWFAYSADGNLIQLNLDLALPQGDPRPRVRLDCCDCVTPPGGMTAWWPLDEAAGTTAADIVGGNDGSHVNGPTPLVGEFVDNSLCFDGISQYVRVPTAPALNFGTDFSIDAWVRANDVSGVRPIVDKRDAVPQGYEFYVFNGRLGFQMADAVGSNCNCNTPNSVCTNETAPTADVTAGIWHHVAVTVARTSAPSGTLYVDGNIVHTFGPRAGPLANGADLWMAQTHTNPCAGTAFWDGCIDEVEFFDRALQPSEVLALFAAGAAGKCKGICDCPGDINGDGVLDGLDIAGFVRCLTGQPGAADNCDCADVNGDGVTDVNDIQPFVINLLNKVPCQPQCVPTPDRSGCEPVACPVPPAGNECMPRCVNWNPSTGLVLVMDCDCRSPNECHVQWTPGAVPDCIAGCPAGLTCVRTQIDNGDGTFDICCDCLP